MVILRRSCDLPAAEEYRSWLAVTGATPDLDSARKLPRLAQRLEAAFNAARACWWEVGKALGAEPGAEIAHMPTAGSFGSDFGLMVAWGLLVAELVAEGEPCLVVCDDPWAFRHLAGLAGVEAGRAPPLLLAAWKLGLRGFLSRLRVALRMAKAAVAMRGRKGAEAVGRSALLVYGHPASNAQGFDVYFGKAMEWEPEVVRMLHTDCPPDRARELGADGRTFSLHGWGNPWFAVTLPWVRWRPRRLVDGPQGWLIRRAAALENGGGGPAMNRWQLHCQARWLAAFGPKVVAWPYENHAWERDLCRVARPLGVVTVGYQHTVIGPHQINYAAFSNWDGLGSIPDWVVADGPAYRDELAAWGVPAKRLLIGGAFRFKEPAAGPVLAQFDPSGAVFVPLSPVTPIARLQLEAATRLAAAGRRVLVKEHPMYPLAFAEGGGLSRTTIPLPEQRGLAAVLFSTGTSGLEALLAGLPTFRLLAEDRISIDILPEGISVPAVTLDEVVAALAPENVAPPRILDWHSVLAPVDRDFWHRMLMGDMNLMLNNQSTGNAR